MLAIDYTETRLAGHLKLTRRIAEIMQEKGDAFSIRAFSSRIGISREYLRLTLLGERPLTPSMLEKIANGLGMSVERIRQMDTIEIEKELLAILEGKKRTKIMVLRARSLANELVNVAVGASERGFSLHYLGRVMYMQEQYDEAHQTWLLAWGYAKNLETEYADPTLLHLVSANLMLTYSIRKDYSNIEELLNIVEKAFHNDPDKLGKSYYTRMIVENSRGNYEASKKHAYRSLEHFEQTHNNRQIGHALINVSYCEYLLGNYKTSARALLSAIKIVEHHEDILIIAVKEYAKTLLKLREHETAARIIEQYDSLAREYPEYWAKMQIMYTVVKNDPAYAEHVSNDADMPLHIRYFACKCLFEYFASQGDTKNAISYYKKGRIYSNSKMEFYDEEGF